MDEDDRETEHSGEEGRIGALELVATSARVLGSSFLPFAIITVLVTAPARVADIAVAEWAHASRFNFGIVDSDILVPAWLGSVALRTVLTFMAQAAMTYATVERLAGRRPGIRKPLATVVSHAGPLLVLAVLQTAAIYLATLACVIPGVALACVLFVSIPAAIVERRGPLESMQRSADLTFGHRLTVFGAALPLLVFLVAATYGVRLGLAALPPGLPMRITGYAAQAVVDTLFVMFQAVLAAVFYARARRIHDGVDADAIAKVFE